MAAIATERWSDRRMTKSIDGKWTAQIGWDVVGFTAEEDAIAATAIHEGSPHPRNPFLICTKIGMVENKFTLCKVVGNFEVTSLKQSDKNPLLQPAKILWKWGKVSQPIDTDLRGNPILNSSRDAFKNHSPRNFSVRYLTITRYEVFYDQQMAKDFTDTVNNAIATFEGNQFNAGQVYCLCYAPVGEYEQGAAYVKVSYAFEIRTPNYSNLTALQIRHPFQLRLLDQGTRGQYMDTSIANNTTPQWGNFYLPSGEQVRHDVLLKGDGTPIDTKIKVTQGMLTPQTFALPNGVIADPIKDAAGKLMAVFLIYPQYPEANFGLLGVHS